MSNFEPTSEELENWNNLQLLMFSKSSTNNMSDRFEALMTLVERMYNQLHLLDKNSNAYERKI